MSLSCALWATSLHQWARRYIRLTQPTRCTPEKRARMRAFFNNGAEKMHIPWAVEGLPALLHLSLFLFFWGLAIFLFNVDHEVFTCVVLWIGLFSFVYVLITMLPLIRHDSPYYTPLSIPAWFTYAVIHYETFKFRYRRLDGREASSRRIELWTLRNRYRGWILWGMEKRAEEAASEQSSDVDIGILDWTIGALGDDDSLEKFFEAIPGFFNSTLVGDLRERLPDDISRRLSNALDGFWDRTLSSNSVIDSVKLHRLDIYLSAISLLPDTTTGVWSFLLGILFDHSLRDQVPQNVEMGHILARWCTSNDINTAEYAHRMVAKVLWTARERNDRWVELAARVYGLSERDVRDFVTHGDDCVSLAILIQITRKVVRSRPLLRVLGEFTRFDIRNTHSGLQHDFCTLWNEFVQEAKNQEFDSTPVSILRLIRDYYIALHQGTDATPIAFSPSTHPLDHILWQPSSYPLCHIPSHRPDSITHIPLLTQPAHSSDAPPGHSTSGRSTIPQQVKEPNAVAGPSSLSRPTTLSEIRDSSLAPAAASPTLPVHIRPPLTIPVHTRPHSSDASPPGAVFAAPQDVRATATLPRPLEGTTQRDVVVSSTEPDILSPPSMTAPTSTQASVPASKPPVLNIAKSLESYDAGAASASTSNPLLPTSSVIGFSIPATPPPPRPPPPPIAESLALLRSTTPPRPSGDAALLRLRVRGLVNAGSMCFANAILQLLVHSPPFWDLFRELGGLKGRRGEGGQETGGCATPLVDATVRLFEEFVVKENELPPMQRPPQQAAGGKPREDGGGTKEHTAVDLMYMYDAMKEKRRLETFLVRSRPRSHPCLYSPNVYRMGNSRMRKSFSASTSTRLMRSCSRYSPLLVVTSLLPLHLEWKNARFLSQARLTWEVEASGCANYLISLCLACLTDGHE